MARSSAGLLHTRRGKGGKTDDITRRIDIFGARLEMLVHGNDPALAGFHSHLLESQLSRIALSSRRDQHRVDGQCRTGGEFEPNATGFQRNAFLHIFFPVKSDSAALKRTHQCLGNFRIQKRKEDIAAVEDMNLGAERIEGAPVFSSDHTGPDDHQSLGNAVQLQDRIGIVNFAVTERKNVGMNQRGTGGDEDLFAASA